MFLRLVRATVSKGVKREYVRVVEAYRDASGKTRHHTIINLGRRDLLARHLDLEKLAGLLHGDARADRAVRRAGVAAIGAWDWGPVLAVRQLWNELGLDHVVAQGGGRGRGDGVSLSERALVLVANRLASPGSEHALAQWLETDFVCDRHGRRWIAAWRDEAERKASRTPRVRVAGRQLQQWYRTLDQLIECKAQIEHALYLRLRDLFSLQVDMVFYDLTSTYFEGKGPPEIGANGHSRDGKPRNPQVLVGLVMVDGWTLPIRLSPTATSGSVRPCSWTFTSVAIFGSHNRCQSSSDFSLTMRPVPATWRRLAGATGSFAPIVRRRESRSASQIVLASCAAASAAVTPD